MAQFLDNTIYTDYALNKICQNLGGEISNFNFVKVKVGSGDNTLSQDRQDLSVLLYSLVIQDLVYNNAEGIVILNDNIAKLDELQKLAEVVKPYIKDK